MILTFNQQFVEKIKNGTKVHTIRTDIPGRWKPGMKIHFWRNNPRHIQTNPYQFGTGVCTKSLPITIDLHREIIFITSEIPEECKNISDFIELDLFARRDGFDSWDYMKQWFSERNEGKRFFQGKLIYFTYNATI